MHRRREETATHATLARWLELWNDQAKDTVLRDIYSDLVKRYSEPHRHYHNLPHISRCLQELTEARSHAHHPFEVELALWFHDAVYDPRRSDNEEASAGYAMETLGKLTEKEILERIRSLILATKHTDPPRSDDERLIADIDLAILGSPAEEYREYEDGIRREYSWVPEDRFKAGRTEVLARFLERDHVYHTGHFREKYEANARANLSHSLTTLRSSI
ncbi:MAG: N-methyl-D-aspartate receptor NMDAR2C subunit [Candidatus Bathyarchaeota archaeon]